MEIQLRPWELSDLDTLVKFANNKNIAANLTDTFPHPYTVQAGVNFIDKVSADSPLKVFAISLKKEAIGSIGLYPQNDIFHKNAELGYWLAEPFWGKGIMLQAINLIVSYGFLNFNLDRIFARPFGSNFASQRVLEKAGFQLEARFSGIIEKNGEVLDELVYAIRRQKG